MAGSVTWVFQMLDKVSAPARAAQKRLEGVEKIIKRVEGAVGRSGGGFGGWAKAGEGAARRVEAAYGRVNARVAATQQGLQGLTQTLSTAGLVAAGIGVGAGYAGKTIVDSAAYKQDQLTSLAGMMKGDREAAARLFEQAQAFAAATPFTTREILDATRQSVAIGFDPSQAIPLVELAGSLSSGSGKSLDQVMEAFAALRGGDFGQAFGVGQGFSNLNISRDMLRQAGLRFNAQGGYEGGIQEGMNAVAKIIRETYGGAMAERSQNISGLASTLSSRPEELFMSLVDSKGQSRALKPLQDFMANLGRLTDFSQEPGRGIQRRFERSMSGLMTAVFGPLADATAGQRGIDAVDRLLDKVDEFSRWWGTNGPGLIANVRGFGEGLKTAADGVMFFLRPLTWLVETLGKLSGGTGEGGLGKVLGVGAGLAAMGWVGNLLSFGLLGKLGGKAGTAVLGGMKGALQKGASGLLTRGALGEILTNPLGRRAGTRAAARGLAPRVVGALRGAGPRVMGMMSGVGPFFGRVAGMVGRLGPLVARFLPWVARLGGLFLGLSNPIGWVVTAVTALAALGMTLYRRFEPFRNFIDGLWDGIKGIGRAALEIGRNLWGGLRRWYAELPAPVKMALGALFPGLGTAMTAADIAAPAGPPAGVTLPVSPNANPLLPPSALPPSLAPTRPTLTRPPLTAPPAGLTAAPTSLVPQTVATVAPPEERVLYTTAGGEVRTTSPASDLDGDGVITRTEAAQRPGTARAETAPLAPQIQVNLYGPATGEAVRDVATQVGQTLHTFALEQGSGGAPA